MISVNKWWCEHSDVVLSHMPGCASRRRLYVPKHQAQPHPGIRICCCPPGPIRLKICSQHLVEGSIPTKPCTKMGKRASPNVSLEILLKAEAHHPAPS